MVVHLSFRVVGTGKATPKKELRPSRLPPGWSAPGFPSYFFLQQLEDKRPAQKQGSKEGGKSKRKAKSTSAVALETRSGGIDLTADRMGSSYTPRTHTCARALRTSRRSPFLLSHAWSGPVENILGGKSMGEMESGLRYCHMRAVQ